MLRMILALFAMSATALAAQKSSPPPIRTGRAAEKWAQHALKRMSLDEKVGQLFMIWARAAFLNVNNPDYIQLRDTVRKYHVGGVALTVRWDPPFLYRNQPYEAADLLNRLQNDSRLPLLVAADFERGLAMRLLGTTEFPHAMAFSATGKPDYAERFGFITALESRAVGVHWNFFPDADVNSNPANPIINIRSFGESPEQVSNFVSAYIRGAHSGAMMATAKHFPGHGDTATDSHLALSRIDADRARLDQTELPPFRAAIAAGVDSVMVGHLSVPALEKDPNLVATTSASITTGLLKGELHFNGLVVTDALDMAGLTSLYAANVGRAAVAAFKAGNDILLIPANLDSSFQAMLGAVRSGEISKQQLDGSVLKILRAKASLGLQKRRVVDLNSLTTLVGKPENIAFGQQVADEAVTLLRDNTKVLPLQSHGTAPAPLPYQPQVAEKNNLLVLIFTDDVRMDAGRTFERQIKIRQPDARVIYVDPHLAQAESATVLESSDSAQKIVAAIFAAPVPGRAGQPGTAIAPDAAKLLDAVLGRASDRSLIIALGSPYLGQTSMQNYLCTYSGTQVSEVAAVKALFGEIAIHGRLPVSIPGFANYGDGLDRPASSSGVIHATN